MILKYEDYNKACWLLGSAQANTDFLRSQFDYGIRQRRIIRGYAEAKFGIVVNKDGMINFKKFWLKLNQGTDKFLTDMPIFGDITVNKTVRFIHGYSITDIDGIYYRIDGTVEIIRTGLEDHLVSGCPLVPSTALVVGAPLVPCGTP